VPLKVAFKVTTVVALTGADSTTNSTEVALLATVAVVGTGMAALLLDEIETTSPAVLPAGPVRFTVTPMPWPPITDVVETTRLPTVAGVTIKGLDSDALL
jgi:hypothetical protein